MRRNGLVNKVKFLGLAHTFVTSVTKQHSTTNPLNEEKQSICDEFLGLAHTLATMSPQSILQQTCKGMSCLLLLHSSCLLIQSAILDLPVSSSALKGISV